MMNAESDSCWDRLDNDKCGMISHQPTIIQWPITEAADRFY